MIAFLFCFHFSTILLSVLFTVEMENSVLGVALRDMSLLSHGQLLVALPFVLIATCTEPIQVELHVAYHNCIYIVFCASILRS